MKKFFTEDMKNITYVSWPAVSRDGSMSACVKYHAEEKSGEFPSKIYLVDNKEKSQVCLTEDDHSEKQPIFSLDGRNMYFLSNQSGEWQVWIRAIDGSFKKKITALRHGITRYCVNERAGIIAFEATLWPQEISRGDAFSEMTDDEKSAWLKELEWTPYVAEDLVYKLDDWHGMRKGEFQHVGYIDLVGSHGTVIDTGFEALYPSLSNDGTRVAFQGYPHHGAQGRTAEVFIFSIPDGNLSQLTEEIGIFADHAPVWSKDDMYIIAAGFPQFEGHGNIMLPYMINLENRDNTLLLDKNITEPCSGVHPVSIGRSEFGENEYYMTLDSEGNWLYFQSFFKGKGGVFRVRTDSVDTVEPVILDGDVHAFALAESGDVVYTSADYYRPPELCFDGARLTESNTWLEEYSLGAVTAGWTRSRDASCDLQYWVVTPPDYNPDKTYPAVFDAKGGPETCYGESFWHEFQAMASEGIVVVYGNPRGSAGYGSKFNADAICWKDEAMEDHLAILDAAIQNFSIDTERLGFTGGSYGGYMTMKLLGRTDTFTAAVAQRALANPVTSYGTGDMGFISSRPVPEDFKMRDFLLDRAKGNIISYVDTMKSPLLILHAAEDYRCGFEQAEQIFIPMHERNPEIPVRLVRFPGENHGLTRTGKLHSQMRHLKELTGWFRRYLVDEPWKRIDTGAKYGCAFENRVTVSGKSVSEEEQ